MENSAPGPPSSQSASLAKRQVSVHSPPVIGCGGGGVGDGGATAPGGGGEGDGGGGDAPGGSRPRRPQSMQSSPRVHRARTRRLARRRHNRYQKHTYSCCCTSQAGLAVAREAAVSGVARAGSAAVLAAAEALAAGGGLGGSVRAARPNGRTREEEHVWRVGLHIRDDARRRLAEECLDDLIGAEVGARRADLRDGAGDVRARHRRSGHGGGRRIGGDARRDDGRAGPQMSEARAVIREGRTPIGGGGRADGDGVRRRRRRL